MAAPRILGVLRHPFRALRARIDAWVRVRVRRQPGPVSVARNRIYIMPTRFGLGFAFMTLVMLLGATNYSNSMAFALTFLLCSLGLVCMHQTHANLLHLQIRSGRSPPVFAGESAPFEFQIVNPSRRPRYNLELSWPGTAPGSIEDVDALGERAFVIRSGTTRRGWQTAGLFNVSSEFPLGLFRAWTSAELDLACLVYPHPAPAGRTAPASAGNGGLVVTETAGQEDFAGLRSYRPGDSMRVINWKSLPKMQQPMVKQFAESRSTELWLDWDALPGLDTESRLSQLARWVLDAQRRDQAYGLNLPGLRLAPACSEAHQHACLRALALFDRGASA